RTSATQWLWAIDGTGPSDVWVCGEGGEVDHYDGASWRRVPATTSEALYHLVAVAPDEAWFAGAHGNFFHLVHGSWTEYQVAGDTGSTLWATGPDDVWAAQAFTGVFHWNGSSWAK